MTTAFQQPLMWINSLCTCNKVFWTLQWNFHLCTNESISWGILNNNFKSFQIPKILTVFRMTFTQRKHIPEWKYFVLLVKLIIMKLSLQLSLPLLKFEKNSSNQKTTVLKFSVIKYINFHLALTSVNYHTWLGPQEMVHFQFLQSSCLPSPTASQLTHHKSRLTPPSLILMRKTWRCGELDCLGRWDYKSSFSSLLSNVCCILLHVFTLMIIWEWVSKKTLMEDKHNRSDNSL